MALIAALLVCLEVFLYFQRRKAADAEKDTFPAINDAEVNSRVLHVSAAKEQTFTQAKELFPLHINNEELDCNNNVEILGEDFNASYMLNKTSTNDSIVEDKHVTFDVLENLASNDHIEAEDKVVTLTEYLQRADASLTRALIEDEVQDAKDFEFGWAEDSDEYQYLYCPIIRSFTTSSGEHASASSVLFRRYTARELDAEGYDTNVRLAREGLARRRERAEEWDQYRLLHSTLVLPFEDSCGERHSEAAIVLSRQQGAARGAVLPRKSTTSRVESLREVKQVCEFLIMSLKEECSNSLKDGSRVRVAEPSTFKVL